MQFYNHYYDEEKKQARPIKEQEERLKTQGLSSEEIRKQIDAKRLAYIDYKPINRCPHCMTGLANEDLDDGKCERCGSEVEQKPMRQWVPRITEYADRLLEGLDKLERDESMKELERNWIGKSEGTEFIMRIATAVDTTPLTKGGGEAGGFVTDEGSPLIGEMSQSDRGVKIDETNQQDT